jgi:DNA-directed RNA polymerase specialized sigma24 family protein
VRACEAPTECAGPALLALAEALESLADIDPRLAQLIDEHWFAGIEAEELASLHQVSLRTVQRELKRARAWLTDLLAS